jgi:transcriptional regulator with XRE-family HTH domain
MTDVSFGALVRDLRVARGWSLRDLGQRILFNRGYVGKVETGDRFPNRQFAMLADQVLEARGALVAAWEAEAELRRQADRIGQILAASVADSLRLLSAPERDDVDDLHAQAAQLPVDYLGQAAGPMLMRAVEVRSQIIGRLRDHDHRPDQTRDLQRSLALVQGVLAYAALDLGQSDGAATHAALGWQLADRNDDNELRAWVRGTQSLISRFESDYIQAQAYVEDGLRYPTPGTGRLRLLAGLAQCRANLGDSAGANAALDRARGEREQLRSTDSAGGLFTFSQAKQHYYAGSSLMWLPDPADSRRAAAEAAQAIAMWELEPAASRSLDDEALAHIYEATAWLHLGDLDEAARAVAPILDLPADRKISWITKRLHQLVDELDAQAYADSSSTRDLKARILTATA